MIAPAAHPSIAASLASGEGRSRSGGWRTWALGLVIAAIIGGVCHATPVTLYDSISGNSPVGSSTATTASPPPSPPRSIRRESSTPRATPS